MNPYIWKWGKKGDVMVSNKTEEIMVTGDKTTELKQKTNHSDYNNVTTQGWKNRR